MRSVNLVLLTHPEFLGIRSQELFARSLTTGFRARGLKVEVRRPAARLRTVVRTGSAAKWAGYFDQYILFPRELRRQVKSDPPETLYVLCDQALGPWLPALRQRPHVVHCHDLIALRAAVGELPGQQTSWTGRIYQRYIRRGFRVGRHFISISQRSRDDLHRVGGATPITSEVVYNGLHHPYCRQPAVTARKVLREAGLHLPHAGVLLHVGGGQWYKNSEGVLALYDAYVRNCLAERLTPSSLWLVSPQPTLALKRQIDALPSSGHVRFLQGLSDSALEALYSSARALLAPSLAEGFCWPIAEALACGCPVVTTHDRPMSEVGGPHAHYLTQFQAGRRSSWATDSALVLARVLGRAASERESCALAGIAWARRFELDDVLERYLSIYRSVLSAELS